MAKTKKDPCAGCAGEDCKNCEHKAHRALALKDAEDLQRQVRTNYIAADLPYDRDVYIREVRFFLGNAADAMIEAGKRLLVIQEKEGRGNFIQIVEEQLDMSKTTVYRLMTAALRAAKFPRIEFSHRWEKSKVYTLLEAPEEDLKELEDKGVLAGNTMDELSVMSRRDLTALVRDLKAAREVIAKGIEKEMRAEMKALQKEVKRLSAFDPEAHSEDLEYLVEQVKTIDSALDEVDTMMRKFIVDERVLDHPEIQHKVEALQTRMRGRVEHFISNWDATVNPA
ncbi:MAG: hypothetical protein M0Z71_12490 [Nitrospiraceae bacterium]|nr:hypothetical protein [Nitrospiraceae bacterium]